MGCWRCCPGCMSGRNAIALAGEATAIRGTRSERRARRRPGVMLPGYRASKARTGAFKPLLADGCQLLTAFPQLERLFQGEAACLQPLNQLGQFVPGLLVRRAAGLASSQIRRLAARPGVVRLTCRCHW